MKRTAKLSFYLIIFIIFGLIGLWMPLLGDDLHWGTYFGSNYFPQGIFLYYDGRYLGDILVIAITKIKPLSFIAYGTFMTTIVYLIQRIRDQISQEKSLNLFSSTVAAILILVMPDFLFQQILGWHAGFANYVPSVIFPLFFLYLVLKNYDNKDVHYYRASTMLIFLAAIFAQFFAEHITVLNVFNSILVWLLFRKHFGEHFKKVLNWIVAGNLVGAFFMFINGAYLKILLGKDSYRSASASSGSPIIEYFKQTFTVKELLVLIAVALLFTIGVIILSLKINNTKQKIANLGLLLSGFVVLLPFLVISPFGARCLFASYVFFITIFTINFDFFVTNYNYKKYLFPIVLLITLLVGVKMDLIAHNYGKTFNMQIDYSEYQNKVNRNKQYFLQYKDDKRIWLTVPIQEDANFIGLYVTDPKRNMIPINYYDWTDALKKVQNKHYKNHDAYLKSFDKQILKKVQAIQQKSK